MVIFGGGGAIVFAVAVFFTMVFNHEILTDSFVRVEMRRE